MNWDEYFMKMCDLVASKSKDPSTKVGAVIVSEDNKIRSTGYNGFPRGCKDDDRYNNRNLKYMLIEHAERNAIYNAEMSLKNCKIYVNSLPPCCDCAKGIIQAGIKEVIIMDTPIPERWEDECKIALFLLQECGVKVRKYSHDCRYD
jgi:dCMP deaminase